MLQCELRSAGLNHAWNEFRGQWRLPLAILAGSDPSPRPTSFARFHPIVSNWPSHRTSHFSTQSPASRVNLDSTINPESLEDTLEAHRAANRASLIHRYKTDKHAENSGFRRLQLDAVKRDGAKRRFKIRTGKHEKNGEEIYYEGICPPPKREWLVLPSDKRRVRYLTQVPWVPRLGTSSMSSLYVYDRLNAEILAFEKYMESTAGEKAAVNKALIDAREVIKSIDPTVRVSVIGSRSTGLAMPLSDLDLNIEDPKLGGESGQRGPTPGHPEARKQAGKLLASISKKLAKKGGPNPVFHEVFFIDAKVPIVQAKHVSTGLEIQIQSTTDAPVSLEMVKVYMNEFPTLRPLFLLMRQMLKMRGLGEPREHGVGSYPLIMMIVAALKFSGSRFDRKDAGRQLLYFLDFYSRMDFSTTGIAVDPPELFSKIPWKMTYQSSSAPSTAEFLGWTVQHQSDAAESKLAQPTELMLSDQPEVSEPEFESMDPAAGRKKISRISKSRPYLMCLQDPANPFNDLGVRAVAIKHVQATFKALGNQLKDAIDKYASGKDGSIARGTRSLSLLDMFVGGNYDVFKQKRRRLQRVGEGLVEQPVVATYL